MVVLLHALYYGTEHAEDSEIKKSVVGPGYVTCRSCLPGLPQVRLLQREHKAQSILDFSQLSFGHPADTFCKESLIESHNL